MRARDDRYYLVHILECIGNVEDDTSGGKDSFLGNRTLRDAVMRNLQVMAESSIRLSDELKRRFPEVEWDELRKFRHVAVHDYIGTDYAIIWLIVTLHLPRLKAQVETILRNLA